MRAVRAEPERRQACTIRFCGPTLKPCARSSAPKLADPATSWRVLASNTARSQSPLAALSVAVTNPTPPTLALLRTTPGPAGSGRLMQFWG